MAREPADLPTLAETIRWAYLVTNAAIPLYLRTGDVTQVAADPEQEHLMTLREQAFDAALAELMNNEYTCSSEALQYLEHGQIPPGPQPPAGEGYR